LIGSPIHSKQPVEDVETPWTLSDRRAVQMLEGSGGRGRDRNLLSPLITKQLIDSKTSLNVTSCTTCWSLAQISTKFWTAKLVDSYKNIVGLAHLAIDEFKTHLSTDLTESWFN
jgi:hypothetical protein